MSRKCQGSAISVSPEEVRLQDSGSATAGWGIAIVCSLREEGKGRGMKCMLPGLDTRTVGQSIAIDRMQRACIQRTD